jgi:hypothetical protein
MLDVRNEILFINKSDSFCGSCGRPANPSEETHETVWSFGGLRDDKWAQVGCGVKWKYVGSEYVGGGIEEAVRNMRPDLEWTDIK